MGNSSSVPKISAQDKAILDMKLQRDKLHQYQRRITLLTSRETEIAKQCLRSHDRPRALLALRRKKYQQSLLQKTDQQLAQLEVLTSDVEFALVQKDVLFGLQQGTKVLKQIHREMGSLESVEKMVGDGEEEMKYQEEVAEALKGRMTNQEEDEVEDELEMLVTQANGIPDATLEPEPAKYRTKGRFSLPDAPAETPKERAKRRERENMLSNAPSEIPLERARQERGRSGEMSGNTAEPMPA